MKELLPVKNVFAIEVPEDAKNIAIKNGTYVKWITIDGNPLIPLNDLAKFRILFTTKNAEIDDIENIAQRREHFKEDVGYWETYFNYEREDYSCTCAPDSLKSLLRSHDLKAPNYLLIKKEQ